MAFLKDLSLALGMLTSDQTAVADTGGWRDFVWRVVPVSQCASVDAQSFCVAVREKWDWKREQHYTFSHRIDLAIGTGTAKIRMENNEPDDSDNVCIVAIFTDSGGREIGAIYSNFRSLRGRTIEREFPVFAPRTLAGAAQVAIGAKQCEKANKADTVAFRMLRKKLLE